MPTCVSTLRSGRLASRFARAAALALLLAAAAGCNSDTPTAPTPSIPFSSTDLVVGTGAEAVSGRRVTMHYTGWFYSPSAPENKGSEFDTSVGGDPFAFVIGAGQVIPGVEQGVVGMRVGGLRRLVIPPELAYGSTGFDVIPPNQTLVFEIELLAVD